MEEQKQIKHVTFETVAPLPVFQNKQPNIIVTPFHEMTSFEKKNTQETSDFLQNILGQPRVDLKKMSRLNQIIKKDDFVDLLDKVNHTKMEEIEITKESEERMKQKENKSKEELNNLMKNIFLKKLQVDPKTGLSNEIFADKEVNHFYITGEEWNEIISGRGYVIHVGKGKGRFIMKKEKLLGLHESEIKRRQDEIKEKELEIKKQIQLNFINKSQENEKMKMELNEMSEKSEIEKTISMMTKLGTRGQDVQEINALANGTSEIPWSLDLYKTTNTNPSGENLPLPTSVPDNITNTAKQSTNTAKPNPFTPKKKFREKK